MQKLAAGRCAAGLAIGDKLGTDGTDTLKNIQLIRFGDMLIDLMSAT